MEEMGGRVMTGGSEPADPIDLSMDRFARGWGAAPDPDPVADGLALRLDVDDLSLSPTPGHPAAVRSLAAALRVERRLGQKEVDQLGLAGHLEELADRRIRLQLLVSGEARRGPGDGTAEGSSHTATAFSLRLHELIDPQGVDADPAVARQLQAQLLGESQCVVEVKDLLRFEAAAVEPRVQRLHAPLQRGREPLLLTAQSGAQGLDPHRNLRIGAAKALRDQGDRVRQPAAQADPPGVQHGPTDHPPENVTASLVGGDDAVGQEHGRRPAVIGQDAQGNVSLRLVQVAMSAGLGEVLQQGQEEVGIEQAAPAAEDSRDPLQPHAGVDPGPGQGRALSRLVAVPGDEDQVPDLEEAVAVLTVGAAVVAAAAVLLTPVVVDLGIGTAGPGRTRGPEVVLVAEAPDAT